MTSKPASTLFFGGVFALLLGSCAKMPVISSTGEASGPAESQSETTAVAQSDAADSAMPEAESMVEEIVSEEDGISVGKHCYGVDSANETGVIRLTVAPSQVVTGDSSITIHNKDQGYYTFYAQRLDGLLYDDGRISMDVTTWIEYDIQQSQEVWDITPQTLQTELARFETIDCDVARRRFLGPNQQVEAADLLNDATQIHRFPVIFPLGEFAATQENSVVRGERDLYQVGAQGGQQMQLSLTADDNNAVFDVITPSGFILVREGTSADLLLPHSGEYQILVGSTRGNSNYTLQIEVPPKG